MFRKGKKLYSNHQAGYSQAGRLDMSAETAQDIPKFERAPLMIPQGK